MKKKPVGFLRIFGAAALVIGLLAATMAPVMAQDEDVEPQNWLDELIGIDGAGFLAGNNAIFYPWVANDDDFGLGPADTSISVQNLENEDTVISIFVGDGAGDYTFVTSAFLAAYAAKTFSAEMLGIGSGDGAPVMVVSFNGTPVSVIPGFPEAPAGAIALVETPVILSNPIADDDDGGESTQVLACVVNYHTAAQPDFGAPFGYMPAVDHTFVTAGDADNIELTAGVFFQYAFTQDELQETLNLANVDDPDLLINPFGGINNDGDCFDVINAVTGTLEDSVAIAGTALQTATAATPGVPGDDDDNGDDNGNGNGDDNGAELEQFVTTHTATSGYNAVNGAELYYFGDWYLPIVQTNCGPGGCWDSVLRVGNFDSLNNSVVVRFFPADDGSGSLQEGFQLQALIDGGDTWSINLGDYVPEGWVGSAHIQTDGAAFAMVDRYKVGYNMWITNTGSSADFENVAQVDNAQGSYALFAPHVLMDYFGWNTGINVANLADSDNNISIQYFNMLGNATQVLSQRLAAHGMTYFYDPSINAQNISEQDVTTDPNAGVVGSAIIWSDFPVAAAVDATKYPETDPTGGADLFQATSYNATQNVFTWQAVPYVTKGNPTDGSGATSGINIMNPNSEAVTANVYWVNPSGFNAANSGVSGVTIPGFANGFVYTLWQQNLPNGFTGAAQVVASAPVAAVSANVNYDVDGDGSAIFNAFNPCGFYRTAWPCTFGDVFEPGGQSVTKTFVDQFGDTVAGVGFQITSAEGSTDFPFTRDGVSGVTGSQTFTNVPVGVYDLYVTSLPAGYAPIDPTVSQETFTVSEGEDVVLENTLELLGGNFSKTVVVEGTLGGDDDDEITDDTGLIAGVNVIVYADGGTTAGGDPVLGAVVFENVTGAAGSVSGNLVPGSYVLCIYDADDDVDTTVGGEVVETDLAATAALGCAAGFDLFTITGADDVVSLINEVAVIVDAPPVGGLLVTVIGADVVAGLSVVVYEGTCAELVAEIDAGTVETVGFFTGAATVGANGEVLLTGVAAGEVCVVVDADNDGDVTVGVDVGVDATVVAEVETPVSVDISSLFTEGSILAVNADVGSDIGLFLGTCGSIAAVPVADAVATSLDDVDGTVTFTGLVAGDYCVVAGTVVDGAWDFNLPDYETIDVSVVVGTQVTADFGV